MRLKDMETTPKHLRDAAAAEDKKLVKQDHPRYRERDGFYQSGNNGGYIKTDQPNDWMTAILILEAFWK